VCFVPSAGQLMSGDLPTRPVDRRGLVLADTANPRQRALYCPRLAGWLVAADKRAREGGEPTTVADED
jgi:hypothetical protein